MNIRAYNVYKDKFERGSLNMYEALIKKWEEKLKECDRADTTGQYLDVIIKIKTIQAQNVSAELIAASRQVMP